MNNEDGGTKLYLIGMPGSGKTTLGRTLAAHFGLPFLDLDAALVDRAGQPIPAIFQQHGEAHFRRLEAEGLRAVAARPGPLVLATGGGTPCFHDNLTVLNTTGLTVWLDVPETVLAARLATSAQTNSRPLLAATGPTAAWLHETLRARREFYERARLRYAAATEPVSALVAQLRAAGFAPASR